MRLLLVLLLVCVAHSGMAPPSANSDSRQLMRSLTLTSNGNAATVQSDTTRVDPAGPDVQRLLGQVDIMMQGPLLGCYRALHQRMRGDDIVFAFPSSPLRSLLSLCTVRIRMFTVILVERITPENRLSCRRLYHARRSRESQFQQRGVSCIQSVLVPDSLLIRMIIMRLMNTTECKCIVSVVRITSL